MPQIISLPPSTPEQKLAAQVDREIIAAANAQKQSYDNIRRLIYQNVDHLTPNQAYAAFEANTRTGLTADQLGQMARLVKASINTFQPGTITDAVPEASISFGE